jgi:hypothetical protein
MMKTKASLHICLVCLGSLLLSGAARAEVPTPDQDFLDRSEAELLSLVDSLTTGLHSTEGALAGLRRILAERERTLLELHATNPLTDLTGIETQDQYDSKVLSAVARLLAVNRTAGGAPPGPEEIAMFDAALGNLPDLGKEALPFMVLIVLEKIVLAADSLVARGDMDAAEAASTALGFAQTAMNKAMVGDKDFLSESGRQDFRQNSVILRMRCPKDNGVYRVNNMKNWIQETGDISRLYYLQCAVCAEPRLVAFSLDLASRLNRMAVRQRQIRPATPIKSYSLQP